VRLQGFNQTADGRVLSSPLCQLLLGVESTRASVAQRLHGELHLANRTISVRLGNSNAGGDGVSLLEQALCDVVCLRLDRLSARATSVKQR